jgi:hypothetical protein
MTDQPPSDRFKTEMPEIPGLSGTGPRARPAGNPAVKLVIGLLALLLVVFLGARWALRPRQADSRLSDRQPQIEVPAPAPDPSTLVPRATEADPGIANVSEMAPPWSSKAFLIRNPITGENVAGILIRLPVGSPAQASGYWGLSRNAPLSNCPLEYVTDLGRLRNEYGFKGAKHPMVVDPCTQTVFDPLKTSNLPGTEAWARGAIVQGSDLRPPLGIEIQVTGKSIQAVRTE